MKFSLPFSLALVASISPALAAEGPAEVTITGDAGEHFYEPADSICENVDDPEAKVTSITVRATTSDLPQCTFYKELDCTGDKWTIKVPDDSEDGSKTQKFSRPFYVASLECDIPSS